MNLTNCEKMVEAIEHLAYGRHNPKVKQIFDIMVTDPLDFVTSTMKILDEMLNEEPVPMNTILLSCMCLGIGIANLSDRPKFQELFKALDTETKRL